MRLASIETERVRGELIQALFTARFPLAIMAITYVVVGSYILVTTGSPLVGAALVAGTVLAVGKFYLHLWFQRSAAGERLSDAASALWERRFAIGHLSFAAALGSLLAGTFVTAHPGVQLLAAGLLFGFCSGQVARVAVRARICAVSIFVAAVPCALTAALHADTSYLILAGMFAVFAAGSVESVRFAYGQARDRIALNHELENVASLDPLTGLLNRLGLRRAVVDIWSGQQHRRVVAVHCLDLDGFKAVNDRHGHAAGDALLRELAQRLADCLQPGDSAIRLGGDEFAVIQTALSHADEADLFARRIARAATASYASTAGIKVGVSIGTCTGTIGGSAFDDMLAVADRRMYAAKRSGGGVCGSDLPVAVRQH